MDTTASGAKRKRVGLIGAGWAGEKRARAAHEHTDTELVAVADVNVERARELAARYGTADCRVTSEGMEIASAPEIDIVVVSTINKFLEPFTRAALRNGKDVLSEKPLGRNVGEAQAMVRAAAEAGRCLKTGFNHRHYPALQELKLRDARGEIGRALYLRIIYGHGGRPGYETEWRMDPELSGGGHLMDQGIHSIDLARWILGDFERVFANLPILFYPAQVEDNLFALMWTEGGQVAQIHAGLTQWKNRFEVELGGADGTLRVEGRGGSYGSPRLILHQRNPQGGRPTETIFDLDDTDLSWTLEWSEFIEALQQGRQPLADGVEGLRAMEIVDALYTSAREGSVAPVVHLDPA